MHTKLPLLLPILLLMACGSETDKVNEAEKEVMTIHDQVMPRMDDLMTLKAQLTARLADLDSLQEAGVSSNTTAEERMKAYDLSRQLSLADSLMMEWMYQYQGDSAKALSSDEALAYFRKEKEKIEDVKEKTDKSIQEAEAFLKE
ncbi:hypothetical protein GCM10027275_48720 [Rhabdobacter roseus]|uniref:Viral A-type inclusion protein n=1 Tax=Rhabdobacter roseus TaxID=1655419 RepID=A0A840TRI0_9BACT|nr:viral A-type inclusion protein [Rhabdobacter roseus]MBB5286936.1 hypothetical protein [Rhabdobacter roseus]